MTGQATVKQMPLRIPTHSLEAEQALLGEILFDGEILGLLGDAVADRDFFRVEHQLIYSACTTLATEGRVIDLVSVGEYLARTGEAGRAGGSAYLLQLSSSIVTSANAKAHAEIIRENANLRRLGAIAESLVMRVQSGVGTSTKLLAEVERSLSDLAQSTGVGNGFAGGEDLAKVVSERIVSASNSAAVMDGLTGLATGFAELDQMTAGLQPGDMIVVAGRPSMGKTAFAINVAEHAACALQKPVAVFSLEMSKLQLGFRLLGSIGLLDMAKLQRGNLTEEECLRTEVALAKLGESRIFVDESGAPTVTSISAKVKRLKAEQGDLGLVVIDYLQLMGSEGSSRDRTQELSGITRGLKRLAMEVQAPIIVLSQLSRKVEDRPDKHPIMSDLRESGSIEQDADIILMMYREEYYKPDAINRGVAEVIINKHRNGPTGTIKLAFLSEFTKFVNPIQL